MAIDPQTHQRLLELIYDLLSEEEAAALRKQIAEDEELAGAYAEARQRVAVLGETSRRKLPAIRLYRPIQPVAVPFVMQSPEGPARAKGAIRPAGSARASRAPWASWAVGLAAAALLVISLSGYLFHRGQLADIAADHLRLRVLGPARLQAGVPSRYAIRTTSVTGYPLDAQIEFALYAPDGSPLMPAHKERADAEGSLVVTIPANLAFPADQTVPAKVKMEVVGKQGSREERLETYLAVEPVRYLTRLLVDKPVYRPGDTIRWRSLTLSRLGLAADRELPIRFAIVDPEGVPVAGSLFSAVTKRGVGSGEFCESRSLREGKYTLVAQSPDGSFPEQRTSFWLRKDRPPQLRKELEFLRAGYAPGENVVADFACFRRPDAPAAGARLTIRGALEGKAFYEDRARTSAAGSRRIEFALPRQIESADAQLAVVVEDGELREGIAKAIPLRLDKVRVGFFPEGGRPVAGLQNRVYFTSRDPLGKPVSIAGKVLGSQGQTVAWVETAAEGAGSFSFKPMAGEPYRLKIDTPAGVSGEPRLPDVSSGPGIVLTAGLAVFDVGKPLEFNVRAVERNLPLVAAATCRGVPVGQEAFVTEGESAAVVIPLDADVSGVIRLTIYDYRSSPPRAVAERLVYRRPARRLVVRVGKPGQSFTPGEKAELALSVTDETGAETAAALGIAVVDEALPGASGGALAAQFLLAGEVGGAEDLEQADLCLSDDPKAAVALDLVLGTQGWRRPAEALSGESRRDGRPADRLAGLAAAAGQPDPPAMFDNLPELQARYQDSLASYRANRTRMLNTLTTLSLFGGAGLVVFVAMLALMSVPSGLRLWVPALGAAAVCVVIGVVLMNPERLKSGSSGAVAFAPFHLPPPELAPPAPAGEGEPAGLTPGHAADLAEKQAGKAEVMKMKRMAPAAAPSPSTPGGLGSFGAAAPPQQSQVRGRGRSDDGGSASKSDAEGSPKAAGTTGRTDLSRLPEAIEMYIEPTQVPRAGGSTPGQPTDQSVVVGKRQVQVQQKAVALEKDESRELLERRGEVRGQASEFRFWQPLLETDARGKASLRFDVSARPARYRVLVDANSDAGGLGFGNGLVTVVLPLVPPLVPPAAKLQSMPAEVAGRDQVNVPLLVAGYPQELSISGQIDGRDEVVVRLPADALPGSLIVSATVFPSPLSELEKGADGLLDPPGCGFEQAAAMGDLGVLILRCLQEPEAVSPAMARRARQLLDAGSKGLTGCASPEGGFEWFGGSPASEPLSAHGLALLRQMAKDGDVDDSLIARTNEWLLRRRKLPGGLPEICVVWALSRSGQKGIEAEIQPALAAAERSSDFYLVALAAAMACDAGRTAEARKLLDRLAQAQAGDGRLAGLDVSPGPGEGISRPIETTAAAAQAWLRLPDYRAQADRAVAWILKNRQASGAFGSPRATVAALQAIVEHRKLSGRPPAGGEVTVSQGEKVLGQRAFPAGTQEAITLSGLDAGHRPGETRLGLQWTGQQRLPYLVAARWRTSQPANDPACPLRLATRLTPARVKENQPVALAAELTNPGQLAVPLPVLVLGLPAGLEVRPETLEQLKKAGAVDGCEIRAQELILAWRTLAPRQTVRWQLDAVATIPGKYAGPASWVYSAFAPERKQWAEPLTLEVSGE